MDAATQGALQAGKPVGGFKIGREAGEWTATNFHPYLPSENYLTCRYSQHQIHDFSYVLIASQLHQLHCTQIFLRKETWVGGCCCEMQKL